MNAQPLGPAKLALAILLGFSVGGATLALAADDAPKTSVSSTAKPKKGKAKDVAPVPAKPKIHKLASGLEYEDVVIGNGTMAENGMQVWVYDTGWLTDSTKIDSSRETGQPYTFVLGTGRMIRGWDEGIKGMRIGGKRNLRIPSDLAYGDEGRPPVIPPKATLLFEVELVNAK